MPAIFSYSGAITVKDGPALTFARNFELDGYNYMPFDLAAQSGMTPTTVTVDLGTTGAALRMLFVAATVYDPGITWKVGAAGTARALTAPLTLAGTGAVSLLGLPATGNVELVFSNATTSAVSFDILVGRDPTTP